MNGSRSIVRSRARRRRASCLLVVRLRHFEIGNLPKKTPASEGAEGTGEAVTGANGNSIVVTRQKCDPNDVETCQANW